MNAVGGDDKALRPNAVARRIVIVGGSFGGLACARALAGSDTVVTVIDRRNHHLFQPLLYQVSTAALSPADIAVPIRKVLARAKNVDVVLDEVVDLNLDERKVHLAKAASLPFDQLVIATGSVYNYFTNPQWAKSAPAPKSISDARTIRSQLLRAFEEAETCLDDKRRTALLTIIVVGGGPTGVEMAGSIAELARYTLRGNFRHIDPSSARVVLIEAGQRLLATFPETMSAYGAIALDRLGVEVRLGNAVQAIDEDGVFVAGDRIAAGTVIWGAGIRAALGAEWLGGTEDRGGRIPVDHTLAVIGKPNVYALGDVALFQTDGQPLPALAQVAQQQGRHLGRALRKGEPPSNFRYRTKGDTAVIGRHAAIYVYRKIRLTGRPAWLLWSFVHVYLLIGFGRRTSVMFQWIWRYITFERGARLID